jgi:hypothetical protein
VVLEAADRNGELIRIVGTALGRLAEPAGRYARMDVDA